MATMEVILLERIDSLGAMGDTVRVKPGYARNYLLPQKKALRATNENKAYFDVQRAELEKRNAEKRDEAEKLAKKLDGLKITLIRNAAEGGQLYGSVTTRDIADAVKDQAKIELARTMVLLNQGFKMIGLFPVTLAPHPEVKVDIIINVARTEEEAKIQAKTGKALVAEDDRTAAKSAAAPVAESDDAAKASMMEEEGLAVDSAREEKADAKKTKKAKKDDAETSADAAFEADKGEEE